LDIALSATLENVDRAGEETKRFLESGGMGSCFFETVLVMREALTNAVIHGSGSDPMPLT
jgi:anti-sigma regulatory factor (Ser/Thr protein kinase)